MVACHTQYLNKSRNTTVIYSLNWYDRITTQIGRAITMVGGYPCGLKVRPTTGNYAILLKLIKHATGLSITATSANRIATITVEQAAALI